MHNPAPNPLLGANVSSILEAQVFRARPDVISRTAWTPFTAVRTGWTDVGAPTVTARYSQVKNVCYVQVKIVPDTSVATTAGASYIDLPLPAFGFTGTGGMSDLTTFIGIGDCVVDAATSRVYVPTQIATADTLAIACWFEV